jgi:hypothetical protein
MVRWTAAATLIRVPVWPAKAWWSRICIKALMAVTSPEVTWGQVDDEVVLGGQLLRDRSDELVCVGHVELAGRADARAIDSWVRV